MLKIVRAINTSLTTPIKANIISIDYRTTYIYAADKLWAAYGPILAFTLISILVVMASVYRQGASHSPKFSTIWLAVLGAQLSVRLRDTDLRASDPLPKRLQKARVRFLSEEQDHMQILDELERGRVDSVVGHLALPEDIV